LIYTTKGSHIFRGVHGINKWSWKPAGNYQLIVISQAIIREVTIFREATIIWESPFLEVRVYIKANNPIAKITVCFTSNNIKINTIKKIKQKTCIRRFLAVPFFSNNR